MFTGIVEHAVNILEITPTATSSQSSISGAYKITIPNVFKDEVVKNGASIAVNGCCLTVANEPGDTFEFILNHETIEKTTFKDLSKGSLVNIERAMKLSDRLDGHIVSGHIDGTGIVSKINKQPSGWDVYVTLPAECSPFVIEKGSICISGVSLTVNSLSKSEHGIIISFTLIPTTIEKTWFGDLSVGQNLNYELDMLAKYAVKNHERNKLK